MSSFVSAEHVIDTKVEIVRVDSKEDTKLLDQKEKELSLKLKNSPPIRRASYDIGLSYKVKWDIKTPEKATYEQRSAHLNKQSLKCFNKIEFLINKGVIKPDMVYSMRPADVTAGPDFEGSVAIGCDDSLDVIEAFFKNLPSKEKQEKEREKLQAQARELTEKTGIEIGLRGEYSNFGITSEDIAKGLEHLNTLLQKPLFKEKEILSISFDNRPMIRNSKGLGKNIYLSPTDFNQMEKTLKSIADLPSPKRIASYEKMANETDDDSMKNKLLESVEAMKKQKNEYETFTKTRELAQKKATIRGRFELRLSFNENEKPSEKIAQVDKFLAVPKEAMKPKRPAWLLIFGDSTNAPTLDGRMRVAKNAKPEEVFKILNELPDEKAFEGKVETLMKRFEAIKKNPTAEILNERYVKYALTLDQADKIMSTLEKAFAQGKKIKPNINNVIFEVSNAKGEVRFYKNQDKEGASIPANATAEQIEALFVGK
jgi:hypothetical protein